MSKSMNPIAAPKTLRYEPDAGLPVAIEAKSNRRYFYPTNGDKFGPDQTNVIRMTLNSNSFIDLSKGNDSLGEIEKELGKLMKS